MSTEARLMLRGINGLSARALGPKLYSRYQRSSTPKQEANSPQVIQAQRGRHTSSARSRTLLDVCSQAGVSGQANAVAVVETATQKSKFANKYKALVLDSTYRPIDVINWQRAICLDLFDKVDVLEYYDMYVKSAYDQHLLPAVLRIRLYVARNRRASNVTVSRRNVMLRDRFTCQYCGTNANLTIDHVMPASKGGKWEWENLVTACTKCNGVKGNKQLSQLRWKLRAEPREPSPYELGLLLGVDLNLSSPPKEWVNYLFELKRKAKLVTDEEITEELTALAEGKEQE